VADEVKGEIRLRGWESPQKSRRSARHLCGQKCVQRMMDNFTAAILAGQQAVKVAAKEAPLPAAVAATSKVPMAAEPIDRNIRDDRDNRDDMPILERMGYDRATAAEIEAESWAGPVKPKESNVAAATWGEGNSTRAEKGFIHAARVKPQPLRPFQRMA
jgi:hypothetical protein